MFCPIMEVIVIVKNMSTQKEVDVHLRRIRSVHFLFKGGKEGPLTEGMDGKLLISRLSRHFCFDACIMKVLFPICTLTWRVNNCVSRQGKGINRKNESTRAQLLITFERFSQQ